jgi:steroid delta-isomerase-like uncharacterized protein
MSTDENKALVRRFVEEVVNQGNIEVVDELFAPDFIEHSLPEGRRPNLDGIKQTFYLLRRAFPDIRQTVDTLVAEGDLVAFCGAHHCTSLGSFMGHPATGRPVSYTEFHMVRIANGQYVEHWSEVDRLGLFQQLDIIPRWGAQPEAPAEVAPRPVIDVAGRKPPGSAEEYHAIMERFFAEVWSKGNMDVVDELISPDVLPYDPLGVAPGAGAGPEGVKDLVRGLRGGFPDMHTVPDQIVAEGEWALTRWTGTGTHLGDFMGRPPTGKVVKVTGMSVTRVLDGQFVEAGDSWDTLGLMQQLGWIEEPTMTR